MLAYLTLKPHAKQAVFQILQENENLLHAFWPWKSSVIRFPIQNANIGRNSM